MADTFGLLQGVASDYGATLTPAQKGGRASITVVRPGGSEHLFELIVEIDGEDASAREAPAEGVLPSFCPDRHINSDGSFCLGWGVDDPSAVSDIESARRWWASVYQFLSRQLGANKRRVFPGAEHGRAHGGAATHQIKAEQAAARLGPEFARKASLGQFVVRRDPRPSKHRLELWFEGKRLARASPSSGSLVGGYTSCPCDLPSPGEISSCGTHATDLATFVVESYRCAKGDREFHDALAAGGSVCCETLENCGLREAVRRIRKPSSRSEKPNARRSKYFRAPSKSKRPR